MIGRESDQNIIRLAQITFEEFLRRDDEDALFIASLAITEYKAWRARATLRREKRKIVRLAQPDPTSVVARELAACRAWREARALTRKTIKTWIRENG